VQPLAWPIGVGQAMRGVERKLFGDGGGGHTDSFWACRRSV
jgi:hypothetical protein